MSIWSEVRQEAAQWHSQLTSDSTALVSAQTLLDAAQADTGISVKKRPAGDALLEGAEAVYNKTDRLIYYSSATDPAMAVFHVAHEFAHHASVVRLQSQLSSGT